MIFLLFLLSFSIVCTNCECVNQYVGKEPVYFQIEKPVYLSGNGVCINIENKTNVYIECTGKSREIIKNFDARSDFLVRIYGSSNVTIKNCKFVGGGIDERGKPRFMVNDTLRIFNSRNVVLEKISLSYGANNLWIVEGRNISVYNLNSSNALYTNIVVYYSSNVSIFNAKMIGKETICNFFAAHSSNMEIKNALAEETDSVVKNLGYDYSFYITDVKNTTLRNTTIKYSAQKGALYFNASGNNLTVRIVDTRNGKDAVIDGSNNIIVVFANKSNVEVHGSNNSVDIFPPDESMENLFTMSINSPSGTFEFESLPGNVPFSFFIGNQLSSPAYCIAKIGGAEIWRGNVTGEKTISFSKPVNEGSFTVVLTCTIAGDQFTETSSFTVKKKEVQQQVQPSQPSTSTTTSSGGSSKRSSSRRSSGGGISGGGGWYSAPTKPSLSVAVLSDCVEDEIEVKVTAGKVVENAYVVVKDELGRVVVSGLTDQYGIFTFTLNETGRYFVEATKEGFKRGETRVYVKRCYGCQKDEHCAYDEECVFGKCQKIYCPYGIILNHTCVEFECFVDADCQPGEKCIDYKCVKEEKRVEIIPENLVMGGEGKIRVYINGKPARNEEVVINNQTYHTDENGYVILKKTPPLLTVKYGDKVYLFKPLRKLLMKISAKRVYANEPFRVTFFDEEGFPVVVEELVILDEFGNVIDKEFLASEFNISLPKGKYTLKAYARGYLSPQGNVEVWSCEACFIFCLDLGKISILGMDICWYWIVITVVVLGAIAYGAYFLFG